MFVKLKNPAQVFFDREQKVTLHGKGPFEVKATGHIRSLLNSGAIMEVEAPKEEKAEVVKTTEADVAAKEAAVKTAGKKDSPKENAKAPVKEKA